MCRRHAGVTLAQTAHHAAAGNDCIHHITKRLTQFPLLFISQRLFAVFQQHVANSQRAVDPQTHGQRQRFRLRCQHDCFVPLRQRVADARQ
ncbi:hypothetical protein D3C81_1897660 [compost metagenome]